MTTRIPLIWTNDDITVGQHDKMKRQVDFLGSLGIPGTFFVVPCPNSGATPLTDDPKLIDLLKQAAAAGHDLQQHSVTHHCIENGTADLRMFDLMGDQAKIDYTRNRAIYERLWEVDALEANIGWGRRVWTEAFGAPSPGYRPGCGSFCGNMYKALENLGFEWCSARLVSMTAWMWAAGHYDYPVRFDGPAKPFPLGKLIEFPILDDVAFRIPMGKIKDLVELGWQLWQMCVERNDPFLLVSHPFALEHEEGTGYAIHQALLTRILATGQAEPMTLQTYYQRVRAGEFPMLPQEERYPDREAMPTWHALGRGKPAE